MPQSETDRRPAAQPRQIVRLRIPGDLLTPVRAFLALTGPGEEAFLLESVAGGETQARYSFLGLHPAEVFEADGSARLRRGSESIPLAGSARQAFARWVGGFSSRWAEPPIPYMGGAVGWVDFSAFSMAEPVLERSLPPTRDPRIVFGLFTTGVIFDHLRQECHLYRLPAPQEEESAALAQLRSIQQKLERPLPAPPPPPRWVPEERPDRERFTRNIAAVKERILAGDTYQVVVSEPFGGPFEGDPFEVYRRLRRLNPSPYHFYVSLGGRQVVGASPEMLLRVEGRSATTIPIAGTRPRGGTPEEDRRLERELLQDPKELAEHAMLVDLARNDLGRVCEFGSVGVPVQAVVERFSHVMHITSEVHGTLAEGRSGLDALWSTFPAGTVSGAPKIRAVEVLSGLEAQDRGVYGGAVGILDTAGNLETCIAIRTFEFAGGRVRFRAGAGIVADSQPESEWKEIHHKAGALLDALGGEAR
ncbi:MAG: anthranilate synthase component I family protein [Acidobacteriota bacterium]